MKMSRMAALEAFFINGLTVQATLDGVEKYPPVCRKDNITKMLPWVMEDKSFYNRLFDDSVLNFLFCSPDVTWELVDNSDIEFLDQRDIDDVQLNRDHSVENLGRLLKEANKIKEGMEKNHNEYYQEVGWHIAEENMRLYGVDYCGENPLTGEKIRFAVYNNTCIDEMIGFLMCKKEHHWVPASFPYNYCLQLKWYKIPKMEDYKSYDDKGMPCENKILE